MGIQFIFRDWKSALNNPFLFTFKILFVSHKQINFWFVGAKIRRIFVICKFILDFLLNFSIVDNIVYPLRPSSGAQEAEQLSCFIPSQRVQEIFEFFFHCQYRLINCDNRNSMVLNSSYFKICSMFLAYFYLIFRNQ